MLVVSGYYFLRFLAIYSAAATPTPRSIKVPGAETGTGAEGPAKADEQQTSKVRKPIFCISDSVIYGKFKYSMSLLRKIPITLKCLSMM